MVVQGPAVAEASTGEVSAVLKHLVLVDIRIFHNFVVLLVGVPIIRFLLFLVLYVAPLFWKLPCVSLCLCHLAMPAC